MSFLLSGAMVFSLLPASAIGTVKAASANYALTATATASGGEDANHGPEKAVDGDTTTSTSRWASEKRTSSESNPHWLKLDFGGKKNSKQYCDHMGEKKCDKLCDPDIGKWLRLDDIKIIQYCAIGQKTGDQSGCTGRDQIYASPDQHV